MVVSVFVYASIEKKKSKKIYERVCVYETLSALIITVRDADENCGYGLNFCARGAHAMTR